MWLHEPRNNNTLRILSESYLGLSIVDDVYDACCILDDPSGHHYEITVQMMEHGCGKCEYTTMWSQGPNSKAGPHQTTD